MTRPSNEEPESSARRFPCRQLWVHTDSPGSEPIRVLHAEKSVCVHWSGGADGSLADGIFIHDSFWLQSEETVKYSSPTMFQCGACRSSTVDPTYFRSRVVGNRKSSKRQRPFGEDTRRGGGLNFQRRCGGWTRTWSSSSPETLEGHLNVLQHDQALR